MGASVAGAPRAQDAQRIKALLAPPHEINGDRVRQLKEVALLGGPDAVLAADRAATGHRGREDPPQQLRARRRIGLEYREVNVAVARVAGAQDHPALTSGDRCPLAQEP